MESDRALTCLLQLSLVRKKNRTRVGGRGDNADQPLRTIEQGLKFCTGRFERELADAVHAGSSATKDLRHLVHAIDGEEIRLRS